MQRLIILTAITLLLAMLATGSALAQERNLCITGVSTAPSVYIDSTSSEVVVITNDGRQLNALRDLLLCPGDEVRTGTTGRVAIRFNEKRTVIRLDGNSRTRILSGGTGGHDVSLLTGILHFVSSVRRHFWVDTPYIVAGIEGTEALIAVQPANARAIAAVRTGIVSAYDPTVGPQSTLTVSAGEAAFRSPSVPFQSARIEDLPPEFRRLIIVSDSAVDWAVYYPPILFVENTKDRAVQDAIVLLASGEYARAEARLNAARGTETAAVASFRTIIAISRNRKPEAEHWSGVALRSDPNFAPAYIAASYVRQASGDLEEALKLAKKAAKLAPTDAYVTARLAEVYMILGDRPAALKWAERSLSIEPTSLALFVAGLANLSDWRYQTAEKYFEEGIERDPEAPLPRLGLGLAYIRQGQVASGTWEIERAIAHDPKRASLRIWLGRAYLEENSPEKAVEEFELAQSEDPEDPTAYLFAAIERYSRNQPIDALRKLNEAEKYPGARNVLRSQAGLYEDVATIGTALGRIYDTLEFDQLAISEGTKAVETAPSNPGAHRFLMDAYSGSAGYDIARTSELLISQLLSPPSKTPVQPDLAESHLALLDTTGPSRVTFAEFAPLFDSDGLRFDVSGLVGTQETWSGEGAVTGLYRGASLSVGQFYYEDDGYRDNNDIEHRIFNAVSTIAFSPEFSLFGEYRHRSTESGDRILNFEIDTFDRFLRQDVEREVARIGAHAQLSRNSDLIGVFTRATLESDLLNQDAGEDVRLSGEDASNSGQAQYIYQGENIRNVTGAAYATDDVETVNDFSGFIFADSFDVSAWSAYSYFYLDIPKGVTWTIGGSAVSYDEDQLDGPNIKEFLPKLGLRAAITGNLTVRASYLRGFKPRLVSEQILEPTSVAGFNQLYDGINGSLFEQIGGAVELDFGPNVWVGAEAVKRWWDIPIIGDVDAETDEEVYRGYVYLALLEDFTIAAEIVHEESESDNIFDFEHWETTALPLTVSYFSETGWFGSAGVEFVDHSFSNFGDSGEDRFALMHAGVGFRLPNESGIISLEAQNLLDEPIHFQNRIVRPDVDVPPRYAPELTIRLRATMRF